MTISIPNGNVKISGQFSAPKSPGENGIFTPDNPGQLAQSIPKGQESVQITIQIQQTNGETITGSIQTTNQQTSNQFTVDVDPRPASQGFYRKTNTHLCFKKDVLNA